MSTTISQRELRNNSAAIMRALDRGERFIITRNGVPVGELRPIARQTVSRAAFEAAMVTAPRIDAARFRDDLDAVADPSAEPRG